MSSYPAKAGEFVLPRACRPVRGSHHQQALRPQDRSQLRQLSALPHPSSPSNVINLPRWEWEGTESIIAKQPAPAPTGITARSSL